MFTLNRIGRESRKFVTIWRNSTTVFKRAFCRYGGHIEWVQFKEYYGMPGGGVGGHEHILLVFTSAFRGIFS